MEEITNIALNIMSSIVDSFNITPDFSQMFAQYILILSAVSFVLAWIAGNCIAELGFLVGSRSFRLSRLLVKPWQFLSMLVSAAIIISSFIPMFITIPNEVYTVIAILSIVVCAYTVIIAFDAVINLIKGIKFFQFTYFTIVILSMITVVVVELTCLVNALEWYLALV